MEIKKILEQLNLPAQAKKYGIPLWQHPQFLFLVMGSIIIVAIILSYTLGNRYFEDPLLVSLLISILTTILFIISFIITQGFEKLFEAARMKSEFVSIASHQLRTPITNIKWIIEILASGRLGKIDEKQSEYLKILNDDTKRMIELIRDLLTVSRIEEKDIKLKKEKIVFPELLSKIIEEFAITAKMRKIKIEPEIRDSIAEITTDVSQIKLVMENLLDNAIRYTKDGGEIKIYLGRKNSSLYFEIKDNGIGIPKEDQKYIFQKFFRANNASRHQTQGSGLGLYIIKAIINRLGGKIGFKSEEDKGSTFWFSLPIKQ